LIEGGAVFGNQGVGEWVSEFCAVQRVQRALFDGAVDFGETGWIEGEYRLFGCRADQHFQEFSVKWHRRTNRSVYK